jgi:hypothetical protein
MIKTKEMITTKRTLILIFILISKSAFLQTFTFCDTIDLNSDGKQEIIKLEPVEGSKTEYTLHINDEELSGYLEGYKIDGFRVIDINVSDKYKEITVHSLLYGAGDGNSIYWYDGKEILHVKKSYWYLTINGNGILYEDCWEGFWNRREKYVLQDNDHSLISIKQFAYYVGYKLTIGKGFKIYKEKELINEVALLSDNSEIELLLCDLQEGDLFDYIYLVKSKSGLIGWVNFKTIWNSKEIPMAG